MADIYNGNVWKSFVRLNLRAIQLGIVNKR